MKPLYTDEQFQNTKSRGLLPLECEKCGKTFYGVKNEIQKYFSRQQRGIRCSLSFKFCSQNCVANGKEYQCKRCGKLVYRTPSDFKTDEQEVFCSQRCTATYTQKDGGHCHWGDDDKARLREMARKNPKFCGWNKGLRLAEIRTLNCIVCNNSYTEKASVIKNRIGVCSKKCLSKIKSSNLLTQYKNGKLVYGGRTKWLVYKNIKVQGTYEYRVCKILDRWIELNKIRRWEYTNDRFEYIGLDNRNHNYLMDFKVWNNDDSFYYLEVKGYEKENDKLKWNAVRSKGYRLEIWFNDDIKTKEKELMAIVA